MPEIKGKKKLHSRNSKASFEIEALGRLVSALAGMEPEEDHLRTMTNMVREITSSEVAIFAGFRPDTKEYELQYISTSLSSARESSIREYFSGIRKIPAEQPYDEMVHYTCDLEELTEGAISKSESRWLLETVGVEIVVSMAVNFSGRRIGALMLGFKKAGDVPSRNTIELLAHCCALALRRRKAEDLLKNRTIELRDTVHRLRRAEFKRVQAREEASNLAAKIETVREQERTNISRELHDHLGQALSVVTLDLQRIAGASTQPKVVESANATLGIIRGLIKSVKKLSSELRPWVLDDLGLKAALEWQAKELEKHTGIEFKTEIPEDVLQLKGGMATALFRIAQESSTNIVRHSRATSAVLTIRCDGERVILEIKDNGAGFDKRKRQFSTSLGIVGMRERVRQLGGRMWITSTPGHGTTVRTAIPINPEKNR